MRWGVSRLSLKDEYQKHPSRNSWTSDHDSRLQTAEEKGTIEGLKEIKERSWAPKRVKGVSKEKRVDDQGQQDRQGSA
jgi:hypothetical protein